jgi:O-antigen ligase
MLLGSILVAIWAALEPKWIFYIFLGLLSAASLPIVTMLLRGMDRFFLGLFLYSLQFYLSFNLVAADRPMPGGVMGLNVSLQPLLAIAYFVSWNMREVRDPADDRKIQPAFFSACFCFLGLASLGIVNASTKTYAAWGLFYHLGLVIVALATCHICSTRAGVQALWKAMWAITITQCSVLMVQRAVQVSFSLTGEIVESGWSERYGGTMGIAPVSVATLLMGLVLFTEVRLLRGNKETARRWAPAFGLAFLCLLLSLTRSAWVAAGIGTVYIMGWIFRRGDLSARRAIAFGGAAFLGLMIAYGPVRERLDSNHSKAAEERGKLNYINLEMIKAHPVIGIGLNNAYESKNMYVPAWFEDGDWVYIAHNQYLLIGAEAGLLGLFAFLRILWIAVKSAATAARAQDSLIAETGAALFATLLGCIWGMFLDFYGGMQVYVFLWFMFGCAAGVSVLAKREAEAAVRAATT